MLPRDRDRLAARERLRVQEHQRRHARAADRLMPLAVHYRQRPGLPMLPPGPSRCPAVARIGGGG
jgi:hypothetical protein